MNTLIYAEPTENEIKSAAKVIKNGGLVAFPTETVYGLGACATSGDAAAKIYAAKGRPSDNPLIIHIAKAEDAEKYCYTTELFYKLAKCFMPGPLTVIMKKRDIIPTTVTGGLDTVAVRIPMHETALKLIEFSGLPIAAPSANISGRPSPTCLDHVVADMNGRADVILGGGECEVGLESTIIRCEEDLSISLLRPGAITPEMLSAAAGGALVVDVSTRKLEDSERPQAPGMKYRHYAPKAKVIVLEGNAESVLRYMEKMAKDESVGFLCDEEAAKRLGKRAFSYGRRDNAVEMAHNLFKNLRAFDDHEEIHTVYADMPRLDGIGSAVYNRLIKAAGFDVRRIGE